MIFRRSLISDLTNSAGGIFTVLFTIVIAVGMVRIMSMAAGGGVGSGEVLQMVVYNALPNLPPLLALTMFIAVLMTLMRWWQDNEMVVWFSAGGRSLLSWIPPVLRFALPMILIITALSLVISPWAKSQYEQIKNQIRNTEEVSVISPGRFIESMGGKRVFFIDSADKTENKVGKIFVAELSPDKDSVVMASSASIKLNEEGDRYIVLHDGHRVETQAGSAQTRILNFENYGVRVDLKLDKPFSSSKVSSLPISVLLSNPTPDNMANLLWRLTWPLAALNLTLLAIPLSCTNPRAGRSLNMILALLIFILYLNGLSICETWVEQEKISFWEGMLLLNGTAFLIAVVFFIRRVFFLRWIPYKLHPSYWRAKLFASRSEKA